MSRLHLLVVLVLVVSVQTEDTNIPQLKITRHPQGGTVPIGSRFDFTCKATTSADLSVTYSWRRIKNLNSLNPVFEQLATDETGSEGVYVEYDAQESAFYFCTVRSGSFETTSEGAYLTVAYLDDFAGDGGPTDNVYNQPGLLSIELQCKVPDSFPYPEVQWYKFDKAYPPEDVTNAILKRDDKGQASNLVIYDIKTTDSGKYHCEISNPAVEVPKSSRVATIEIYPEAETKGAYPPQDVVGNYKVQGHEGTTITLYAGVASKPSADYTWTLNGKVVGLDDDRMTLEDTGRSLVINPLSTKDTGTYLISYAISGAVKGSKNIDLTVIEAIKAVGDVYDFATVQGEDLVLSCGCTGSPPDWITYETDTPGTQWFKNGMLLVNSTKTTVGVTVNGKNTGEARITSVSDNESGTYSCSCFNQDEYKVLTKNVYVADERQALTITAQKQGWGLVGSTISIACSAKGIPRPNIDWYKSGNKVVEGVFPRDAGFKIEYEYSMFQTIGYLVVDGGLHEDSGTFTCQASHIVKGLQYKLNETAELIVAYPTSSRIQCLDSIVQEGQPATIVCGVSGVPMPTVVYTKVNETDSSLIDLDKDFGSVTNMSYFVIHDVKMSDAGTYRGTASNVDQGGLLPRYDEMKLTVTPVSSRMSMNAIIGIAVLVAFLLIGGLIAAILFGRWRRETAFKNEMKRLMKKRDDEVSELQQRLQLRSMEHRTSTLANPLHQLPETRRQLPSFYAANIAVLAATPSAKFLPPSLADLKKRKLTGSVIHERSTVSPSSVKTVLSDIENPENYADDVGLIE